MKEHNDAILGEKKIPFNGIDGSTNSAGLKCNEPPCGRCSTDGVRYLLINGEIAGVNDNNNRENKDHNNYLANDGRHCNNSNDDIAFENDSSNTDTTKLVKIPGVVDKIMVEIPGVTKEMLKVLGQ